MIGCRRGSSRNPDLTKFSVACEYIPAEEARELCKTYAGVIGSLVEMINNPDKWVLHPKKPE